MTSEMRYALDPVIWARECLRFEPDLWQEKVLNSTCKRMLLNCSRQSGKSTTAGILALHRALFHPGTLVLLLSPSLRQSGELFRKVNEHIRNLKVPPKKLEDNSLSCKFSNGSRIVSLPGTEATVRGYSGVDLIIEDESSRVQDDLYFSVKPMLAVSGGRHILMSTPFGMRGHFFNEWENGGDIWERIRITADECPRITKEFLADELRSLGEWVYKQEYFCEFVAATGQVFSYEQIMAAMDVSVKPLFPGVQVMAVQVLDADVTQFPDNPAPCEPVSEALPIMSSDEIWFDDQHSFRQEFKSSLASILKLWED